MNPIEEIFSALEGFREHMLVGASGHMYGQYNSLLQRLRAKYPLQPTTTALIKATDFLEEAKKVLSARGIERDQPDGERNMEKIVEAFNAITSNDLTEFQGWLFMVMLKLVRAQTGKYNPDDFIDANSYTSLAAECKALKEKRKNAVLEPLKRSE